MNSVDDLVDSVRAGVGFLALSPVAVMKDGLHAIRGMRTREMALCRSPLDLAARLDLEAMPGIRSLVDLGDLTSQWTFESDDGAPTEAPDLVATMCVNGRTAIQAISVIRCGDTIAEARMERARRRCSALRLPHGIITDERRDWVRAGSLLWIAGCVERGASSDAREAVGDALRGFGQYRALARSLRAAAWALPGGIAEALDALGCMIFEKEIHVDLDHGALRLDEPLSARWEVRADRRPPELAKAWNAGATTPARLAA